VRRTVLAVTGSRAEYGAMRPVFEAVVASARLRLELIVTCMHFAPQFRASLAEIEVDDYGPRHLVPVCPRSGCAAEMARALGETLAAVSAVLARIRPDLVLVQGDRGEMLAAAAAAAHLNIPVVHMSGGDITGSIDDSIRSAITAFAHVHLTTCKESSARVLAKGEAACRVFEVGEPALDVITRIQPLPWPALAAELGLDPQQPFILATLHPVTTEAHRSGAQIHALLTALQRTGLQTVFSYPNTDAGHEAIVAALQAWQPRDWLHVVAHLGSHKYLSLMRRAAVLVGNSSSGILEAPSFRVPAVNIGTRQHGRTRACNVIDAGYDIESIGDAIARALNDPTFRAALAACVNPYGDGRCAERTVRILERLQLDEGFTAKWLVRSAPILAP